MMPGSFRRAQLRGSDEIFRPTRSDEVAAPTAGMDPIGTGSPPAAAAPGARPEGRLVRLTDEEIDILSDAIQRMRYPTQSKPAQKPSIDVFERLGELRQRLLDAER